MGDKVVDEPGVGLTANLTRVLPSPSFHIYWTREVSIKQPHSTKEKEKVDFSQVLEQADANTSALFVV